jgi:hypothetical protein
LAITVGVLCSASSRATADTIAVTPAGASVSCGLPSTDPFECNLAVNFLGISYTTNADVNPGGHNAGSDATVGSGPSFLGVEASASLTYYVVPEGPSGTAVLLDFLTLGGGLASGSGTASAGASADFIPLLTVCADWAAILPRPPVTKD